MGTADNYRRTAKNNEHTGLEFNFRDGEYDVNIAVTIKRMSIPKCPFVPHKIAGDIAPVRRSNDICRLCEQRGNIMCYIAGEYGQLSDSTSVMLINIYQY